MKNPQNIFDLLREWEAAPYDGLRGKLPDWTPEVIVIGFMANRYKIGSEILDGRVPFSEVFIHLNFYIEKEKLWRREDNLLELHRHEEALKVSTLLNNLKPPESIKLDDAFDALAKLHEDLKLGQDACLCLWLGNGIAQNNLVGEAQRERSAAAGVESGRKRRDYAQHGAVINCAKSFRRAGESRRGLASKIKSEGGFSMTVRQINHILKEENIK